MGDTWRPREYKQAPAYFRAGYKYRPFPARFRRHKIYDLPSAERE